MQWLKMWLMKWLGVNELRAENTELIQRLDSDDYLKLKLEALETRVESVREGHVSVKEMGDACMARLDRETMKLAEAIAADRDAAGRIRAELIDIVKLSERDEHRIAELEIFVKDATLDTALAALEDRVVTLEAAPLPAVQHGRRGGSAWVTHQVAAAEGAALGNGTGIPLPTPGVS